jgi:hypothetical protein
VGVWSAPPRADEPFIILQIYRGERISRKATNHKATRHRTGNCTNSLAPSVGTIIRFLQKKNPQRCLHDQIKFQILDQNLVTPNRCWKYTDVLHGCTISNSCSHKLSNLFGGNEFPRVYSLKFLFAQTHNFFDDDGSIYFWKKNQRERKDQELKAYVSPKSDLPLPEKRQRKKMGQEARSRPKKKEKKPRVCLNPNSIWFSVFLRRTHRLFPFCRRRTSRSGLAAVMPNQLVEDLPSRRIDAGLHWLNDVQPQSSVSSRWWSKKTQTVSSSG